MMGTKPGRRVCSGIAIGLFMACMPSVGASMPSNSTALDAEGVEFEVRVSVEKSSHTASIEYRVRNTGTAPLAVFDRGDTRTTAARAPASGKMAAPPPSFESVGADLSLNHLALALPKPAPTVPRVSLATRVEAGATHEGHFVASIDASVARLRYCLGTTPFDAATFIEQEGVQPPAWRTPFALADTQRRLCTPWYRIAEKRFEEP
jgi:hypothetical protein